MLSIVIADDERDIVKLVRMLIEYPDAEIVGEAYNSEELHKCIDELHPNTVITDICMPGMSGLEFIEQVRDIYPDVNFIVMSGYSEFEYARQAVKLGVLDYLLKPVSKLELNRVLKKIDAGLVKRQQEEKRSTELSNDFKSSVEILRKRYILDVWKGGRIGVPEIGDQPIFNLKGKAFQCLFFSVDSRFDAKTSDAKILMSKSEAIFSKIIENEISAGLEPAFESFKNMLINIVIYDHQNAESKSRSLLRDIGEMLRTFNYQNGFARVYAASSSLLDGDEETIDKAIRQAETAVNFRLEKPENAVIKYSEEEEQELEKAPHIEYSQELCESILRKNIEKIRFYVEKIFEKSSKQSEIPGIGFRRIKETLDCINDAVSKLEGVSEVEENLCLDMFDILSGSWSSSDVSKRIFDGVKELLNKYDSFLASKENILIIRVKEYISAHFAKEITLNDVARHVCLNPAYLSTLFKEETGLGFLKYLKKVRVDEAKRLLKSTNMRIEDIAHAVGYKDVKSFNKTFADETQVKPSAYRKFYA